MTANAFLSVSLRPPLVLVSLGRCRMSEMLPRTGRYGVSVLAADQEHFAAHFAGQRASRDRPRLRLGEGPAAARRRPGPRRLPGRRRHPAGDHVLWIGEVEHLPPPRGRAAAVLHRAVRDAARGSDGPERLTATGALRTATAGARGPDDHLAKAALAARAIHTRQSARRRTAGPPAPATTAASAAGRARARPARRAARQQLDQGRQRPRAGDPQQLGRHPARRGAGGRRADRLEVLLVRQRRVLAGQDERRRVGRQPRSCWR